MQFIENCKWLVSYLLVFKSLKERMVLFTFGKANMHIWWFSNLPKQWVNPSDLDVFSSAAKEEFTGGNDLSVDIDVGEGSLKPKSAEQRADSSESVLAMEWKRTDWCWLHSI
jgi:hypothetical protein